MIRASITRIGKKIIPASMYDEVVLSQLQEGKIYAAQIWRPRNIKLHNLYFALLRMFVHNTPNKAFQPKDDSPAAEREAIDTFRKAVQIYCGSCEYITDINNPGVQYVVPKSIAFDSMDEEEFEREIFNPTVKIISKLLGASEEEILDSLGDWA